MDSIPFTPLTDEELAIADKVLAEMGDHTFLFATITGTHQYGFTSPDSDIDVRAAYAVPTIEVLGLKQPRNHAEYMGVIDDREADGVAFELDRFVELVLKGGGNLIEELFSPIVLAHGDYLEPLREAVGACLSRRLIRHYIGFYDACMRKLHSNKKPPEVKSALYALRIALTGIHLMREGVVVAHLPTLAELYDLEFVPEWIAMKTTEHEPIPPELFDDMIAMVKPWRNRLKRATKGSVLPAEPSDLGVLDGVMKQIRLDLLDK